MNPVKVPQPLQRGVLQLWSTQLEPWRALIQELSRRLSQEEISRSARLKVKSKAEDLLISRGILRLILAGYQGMDPQRLELKTTPAGKPYLPDSPLHFNLSHSGDRLLVGVILNSRLGIDLQQIYPISNPDRIVEGFFSPAEKAYLAGLPRASFQDSFFSIWTAKEAFLKGIGSGFQEDPSGISLIPAGGTPGLFGLDLAGANAPDPAWTITSLDTLKGFKAAAAVEGNLAGILSIPLSPGDCLGG